MSKLKNSALLGLITNGVLIVVLVAVFAVSFIPSGVQQIYGGVRVEALYNGNRENAKVSLMFNVYQNTEIVGKIVDTLCEYNATATFFVGGCWADDNGEMLIKIAGAGHEIGNHGYFHKEHKTLTYEQNREEISLTGLIVEALCGVKLNLFAPPSGSFSEVTLEVCYDLNYKVIMWSKDTIDWRDKSEELVYSRATKGVENGDFILMHPTEHTLSALPRVLEYYKSVNLKAVSVSENLKDT